MFAKQTELRRSEQHPALSAGLTVNCQSNIADTVTSTQSPSTLTTTKITSRTRNSNTKNTPLLGAGRCLIAEHYSPPRPGLDWEAQTQTADFSADAFFAVKTGTAVSELGGAAQTVKLLQ